MTREQLAHFLSTAARVDRRYYPLWLTMSRTGVRPSEARGLWWDDLNFSERAIRVARSLVEGDRVDTPKSLPAVSIIGH